MATSKEKLATLPEGFTSGLYQTEDGQTVVVGIAQADPDSDVHCGTADKPSRNFKLGNAKIQFVHEGSICVVQVTGYRYPKA